MAIRMYPNRNAAWTPTMSDQGLRHTVIQCQATVLETETTPFYMFIPCP